MCSFASGVLLSRGIKGVNYGANCGANRGANYIVEVLFLVVEMILSVACSEVEKSGTIAKLFGAFVVGGLICAIASFSDLTSYTPAHIKRVYCGGGILGGFGLYDRLIEFAGAGACCRFQVWKCVMKELWLKLPRLELSVLTGMFEF